jgi:two-component system, NtrC family, response regulator AtoC
LKHSILLVEDQAPAARLVLDHLGAEGYGLTHCASGEEALSALRQGRFDLVLLDLGLPDLPGQEVLTRILASRPWLPVIMLTGQLDAEAALQCLRLGARDYLTKPYQLPHLSGALQRELHRSGLARRLRALRSQGEQRGLERLQGDSAGLQQARALLQRAAGVDIGVLLSGETGTGKDLAAQALHEASPRAKGPLVALDCGALPEKLLDAELFGHEKGAFTGADAAKKGRIEMAQGGTLFLDEVGELSLESQARLMRVLQERCLRRVGGSSDIPVDIRVVAATHVDLAEARRDGRFREDLYHRLAEFVVHLPPLRERGKDIVELAQSLLQVAALAFEKPVAGISPEAQAALQAYRWPGNVRELMHVMRQALIRCGGSVGLADLPDRIAGRSTGPAEAAGPLAPQLQSALDAAEKVMVGRALEACRWNRGETARCLEIDVKTLAVRMQRHGYAG